MASFTHEPVQQALHRLRELSADEETRRLALVRERALHDEVSFLNEAKREGREEGVRDALRAQLSIKFGELPKRVDEQIDAADYEQLRGWMQDLLFADSLDRLFKH